MWQDIVIFIGQFLLAVALIPSILSDKKPSWSTSLLTAIVLSVFAVCFYTLKLYGAMIAVLLGVLTWVILLVQVLRRK